MTITPIRLLKGVCWLLAAWALPSWAAEPALDTTAVATGKAIYLDGRLPDGIALKGERMGLQINGKAAACVACHRPSGMGNVEGDQQIAPITGNALFLSNGRVAATMDPARGKFMNQGHPPYTDEDFANAVRKGLHQSGRDMNELMPRYDLSDAHLQAVSAYLRTLSATWSPGVQDNVVHLATIITPDADPAKRQVFIDTLQATISQKNGNTMPGKRHMVSAAEFGMKTERLWDMHVWELQGPPTTWGAQLKALYDKQPVFAVVSGLAGNTWAPVHTFCETQKLPCWFPSVDMVPPEAGTSQYSLYFSRGTALEGQVLAQALMQADKAQRPKRVVQVLPPGLNTEGADALKQALNGSGIPVESRVLANTSAPAYQRTLAGLGPRDAVMLWLHADDMKALTNVTPPPGPLYFSAAMGDAERAPLPANWKGLSHLVYPYELPQKRGANLAYFRSWINQRKLPLLDEPLQNEVYFAVTYFSDTMSEMLNNLYRDYLIERAESMLSRREARKAEEETHERQTIRLRYVKSIQRGYTGGSVEDAQRDPNRAVISPSDNLGQRTGTTVYPTLSLGPGQRIASKGAYIVKFANANDNGLVAQTDWIVP